MKILFAHDHKFFRGSKGTYFSPGNFHYRIWERYLTVFDSITVVAREQKMDSRKRLLKSSGPNVEFATVPSISSLSGRLIKYHSVKKEIHRLLQSSDALIARLPSEIGLLAIQVAQKSNKPWAVEVVGCVWDAFWTHGSLNAKLFAPYAYLRTKQTIAQAPYSLYVTEYYLQQRYPSNGIQTNCSNVEINTPTEYVLKNKLSILQKAANPYNIGLIGSLQVKGKGFDTAFKALSLVKKKHNNIILEIVGDGDQGYWTKLAKKYKLSDHVIFKGTLKSGDEINNWLDTCHLYIQPSLTEGLPRALIEAMSRGCPVIASDVGGIPELLDERFLHKPKDYYLLASLINSFIDGTILSTEQAKRNFEHAKNYSKHLLDKKRNEFWKNFLYYCKQNAKDN